MSDDAAERAAFILDNLAGQSHEEHARVLLRTEAPDVLLAAHEHMQNARRKGIDIRDDWAFFTKVSLPEVKGERRDKPKHAHRPETAGDADIEGRFRQILEDCDGDRDKAARHLLSMVLGRRIARASDESGGVGAPLDLCGLYTACDVVVGSKDMAEQSGRPVGAWFLPAGELCRRLRALGLPQWAAWHEGISQGRGGEGD